MKLCAAFLAILIIFQMVGCGDGDDKEPFGPDGEGGTNGMGGAYIS